MGEKNFEQKIKLAQIYFNYDKRLSVEVTSKSTT